MAHIQTSMPNNAVHIISVSESLCCRHGDQNLLSYVAFDAAAPWEVRKTHEY